jgi:hypothetical protein
LANLDAELEQFAVGAWRASRAGWRGSSGGSDHEFRYSSWAVPDGVIAHLMPHANELEFQGGAPTKPERENGNDGGQNRDHACDGTIGFKISRLIREFAVLSKYNNLIVFRADHLQRILGSDLTYHNSIPTHLALD